MNKYKFIGYTSTNTHVAVPSQTILPKIFNVSSISRFDVYWNPSEKLQKEITSLSLQTPHTYNLIAGFNS
jgi:hypothetical protein